MNYFLYGPPLTGKSTIGRALAARLQLAFVDLDDVIQAQVGSSIADIFREEGESAFRQYELAAIEAVVKDSAQVIALGGGALLNATARSVVEKNGIVLCLNARFETLISRSGGDSTVRPLLSGDQAERLKHLLQARAIHYQSFALQLLTDTDSIETLTWQAQVRLGAFRVSGMGQPYDIRVIPGGLSSLGKLCKDRNLIGPMMVVSDQNVGAVYGETILSGLREAGYSASIFSISPGEENKNIQTILQMWDAFIKAGVERSSTVIALGGGVVGDMAGFAAATFLRGISWVNVPTSLLAMVDSSLGGKTGIDLPQAKNLVGAFYPPRLVLADPLLLHTLPLRELRNGLAEVIKHGIIGDPDLYALCAQGLVVIQDNLQRIVCQGMALKVKVIEADPFEKGIRQGLNLGHTIGHGVEISSSFRMAHGEAVAIGMVAEALLAEEIHLAEPGLSDDIRGVISGVGLPIQMGQAIPIANVIDAMMLDKKRAAGKIHFALPVKVGEVKTGVVLDDWQTRVTNILSLRS